MSEFQIDPQEQAELDALAGELQQQLGPPAMSEGFVEQLQDRMQAQPWSLRSAIRRNSMLRVAAGLLLMTTVAGPVSALIILFAEKQAATPTVIWDPPSLTETEEETPEPNINPLPPSSPKLEEAFGLDWHAAVEKSNRMALVIRQWNEAQQEVAEQQPSLKPEMMDWSGASLNQLEQEFRRRCQLGIVDAPQASLAERIMQVAPDQGAWVQAWQWALEGQGLEIQPFFKR